MAYLYLFVAIIAEIFATTMLKDTNGFTVLFPSIFTIAGYILSFYMLSLCVQYIPTGIIYVSEAASLVEVVHGVRVPHALVACAGLVFKN